MNQKILGLLLLALGGCGNDQYVAKVPQRVSVCDTARTACVTITDCDEDFNPDYALVESPSGTIGYKLYSNRNSENNSLRREYFHNCDLPHPNNEVSNVSPSLRSKFREAYIGGSKVNYLLESIGTQLK